MPMLFVFIYDCIAKTYATARENPNQNPDEIEKKN